VRAFHDTLGLTAEGVVGPSQWEPGLSFPTAIGPDDLWFARNFRRQFGREPEYTAAGSFATSLIFEKCVRDLPALSRTRAYCLLPPNSTVTPSTASSAWIRRAADKLVTGSYSFSGIEAIRSCSQLKTVNRSAPRIGHCKYLIFSARVTGSVVCPKSIVFGWKNQRESLPKASRAVSHHQGIAEPFLDFHASPLLR
jgi:hypothetical protein